MDQQQNQGATQGQSQGQSDGFAQDAKKAQQDLSQVAGRAKAATAGFSIEKVFQGRIDNLNFFYFAIASIVASLILMYIPLVGWIISLALGVLGIGATIRRWHDLGQTGWLTLLCVIPVVNLLALIYLCWKTGAAAANAYGPAPDPKREFFQAVLNT